MIFYRAKLEMEDLHLPSLALLLANDHILKVHFGCYVTGKLSDFAGPFVLHAILRLNGFGFRFKTAGFITIIFTIVLKFNQVFADFVASNTCGFFWQHCRIIADPTDVIALVPFMLLLRHQKKRLTDPHFTDKSNIAS